MALGPTEFDPPVKRQDSRTEPVADLDVAELAVSPNPVSLNAIVIFVVIHDDQSFTTSAPGTEVFKLFVTKNLSNDTPNVCLRTLFSW